MSSASNARSEIRPDEIPIEDAEAFRLMRGEMRWGMDGLFQVEGALYVSLFTPSSWGYRCATPPG